MYILMYILNYNLKYMKIGRRNNTKRMDRFLGRVPLRPGLL